MRNNVWKPYVPKVHYDMGDEKTLCGVKRKSHYKTHISRDKTQVTCTNCINKMEKVFSGEHFDEDTFTI